MNMTIFGVASLPIRNRSAAAQRTNGVHNGLPAPTQSLLARMETWLWRSRQRELERRLAGCLDVFELEARLRQFERVAAHRRYE